MLARLLPLAVLALIGCTRSGQETALLTEAKRHLSERDARLTSYRLTGQTREGDTAQADFTFLYRAPQRMQGVLGNPRVRTFSWDGELLFDQHEAERRFTTFKSEVSPEKRAGYLTEIFGPFVPEGFRAPLLPANATARRASHPRAAEAVELVAKIAAPSAAGLEVAYTLRWPTLDFLGKRMSQADGSTMEVRVEEEHCEESLKLCVPKRLTRWVNGAQVSQTTLSQVELNPALPNDTFTLTPPEGYEVQTKTLVDAEAQ